MVFVALVAAAALVMVAQTVLALVRGGASPRPPRSHRVDPAAQPPADVAGWSG